MAPGLLLDDGFEEATSPRPTLRNPSSVMASSRIRANTSAKLRPLDALTAPGATGFSSTTSSTDAHAVDLQNAETLAEDIYEIALAWLCTKKGRTGLHFVSLELEALGYVAGRSSRDDTYADIHDLLSSVTPSSLGGTCEVHVKDGAYYHTGLFAREKDGAVTRAWEAGYGVLRWIMAARDASPDDYDKYRAKLVLAAISDVCWTFAARLGLSPNRRRHQADLPGEIWQQTCLGGSVRFYLEGNHPLGIRQCGDPIMKTVKDDRSLDQYFRIPNDQLAFLGRIPDKGQDIPAIQRGFSIETDAVYRMITQELFIRNYGDSVSGKYFQELVEAYDCFAGV